jgi:hypothetical protein
MRRVVEKKCEQCKRKFMVTKRKVRQRFCSNICRWQWHNRQKELAARADIARGSREDG